ncbi:phage tail protein [Sphingomicrobium sediminis]|uniref:Phage tail protein n=1 Tax=Sphingomicrobium sediminis TaxID=2950949 RepID=A0A9X2EJV1_9SPHN|nr:phage tail protein [Sphingomicrobium sediminis]MCM8556924.1 phage tail protein [Sphingomicrobium sediminis]
MIKLTAISAAVAVAFTLATPQQAHAGPDPFLGEIMEFGGNFCPRGWTVADGKLLAIAQNQALFSLLGTMYGGDGRTTFAVPDLDRQTRRGDDDRPRRRAQPITCIATQGIFPSRS